MKKIRYALCAAVLVALVGLTGLGGYAVGKAQLPENAILWEDADATGLAMVGGQYLLEFTVYESRESDYHVLYTGFDVKGDLVGLVVPKVLELEIGNTYVARGTYVMDKGFDIYTIYQIVETWPGWEHGPEEGKKV